MTTSGQCSRINSPEGDSQRGQDISDSSGTLQPYWVSQRQGMMVTLKNARACGCCRFISLKAGLSTLCAMYFRALAMDFFAARLAGAFLGFFSCKRVCRLSTHWPHTELYQQAW